MCGIAGAVGIRGAPVDTDVVASMLAAIRHRGPDGTGVIRVSDSVVLAHARLAIFDVSERGTQPMQSDAAAITYNGEVFNFKALGKQLEAEEALETRCDTEVVLRWLKKHGVAGVADFDGFFSLAFWDGHAVTLIRDRFGQKPLYYAEHGGVFYFASEVKALVAAGVPLRLREGTADYVRAYRFSESLSPFDGIEMLAAGSCLQVQKDGSEHICSAFYQLPAIFSPPDGRSRARSAERNETEQLLLQAVKKRLAADVPVGIICSGGLDSSLIAWAASTVRPVDLFHVDVEGASEREYAEEVAAALGCPLHVVPWSPSDHQSHSRKALLAYEYPMVHPNSTALLAVAALARSRGVPVLLGGEAADELFGGYVHHGRYRLHLLLERYLGTQIARLFSRSGCPAARWKQHTRVPDRQIERRIEDRVAELAARFPEHRDPQYAAFLLSDFEDYLPPLLLRGDKMSMTSGVELRLPFMDRALVEHALALPDKLRRNKKVLRQIAETRLPQRIARRKKVGFAFPNSFYTNRDEPQSEGEEHMRSLLELKQALLEEYAP